MYKIETHLHTVYSSICGELDAATLINGYAACGYSALVVTDHFSTSIFKQKQVDLRGPENKAEVFLEGYYRVKEEGERQGIRVYKGAELRFYECSNDYLFYGFENELLMDPDQIFSLGLAAFYKKYQSDNHLLIQAHPYRLGCTPADPKYLDGVEVLNLHPKQNNHNDMALAMAEQSPHLIRLSGSDCHQMDAIGRGGIIVQELPEDEAALVKLLRSRAYSLIGE